MSRKNRNYSQRENNTRNKEEVGDPRAPYNFVPPPENIYYPEGDVPGFDKFDGLSGYIDYAFKNLTHLYIDDGYGNPYRQQGKLALPGSSVRGMLRQLVEVMSYSRLVTDMEKKAYRRLIEDKNEGENMDADKEKVKTEFGLLSYKNQKYYIRPISNQHKLTTSLIEDINEESAICIDKESTKLFICVKMNKDIIEHEIEISELENTEDTLEIPKLAIDNYINDSDRGVKHELMNDLLDTAKKGLYKKIKINGNTSISGMPVFFRRKDKKEISSLGHCKQYRIPYKYGPGSYIPYEATDQHKKMDFSTRLFGGKEGKQSGRLYFEDAKAKSSIGEEEVLLEILGSPNIKSANLYVRNSEDIPDYDEKDENDSVAGFKFYWHKKGDTFKYNEVVIPRKHYEIRRAVSLGFRKVVFTKKEFDQLDLSSDQKKLFKHFNHKQYYLDCDDAAKIGECFAHINARVKSQADSDNFKQFKVKKLSKPGNVYKGRIYFENLSDVELGALLTALHLQVGCAHKIGMGKPLGLGSIKLDSTETHVTIIDRDHRYEELLNDDGSWNLCERKYSQDEIQSCKKKFKDAICKLKFINQKDFWEIPRIEELKEILTMHYIDLGYTDQIEWLKQISYMHLEEFKNYQDIQLPSIKEIIDDWQTNHSTT